jgi:6-phosphofructokinase 1
MATRLANRCIDYLIEKSENNDSSSAFIGLVGGSMKFHMIEDFYRMSDVEHQRPKDQWWLEMVPIAKLLAQPSPSWQES